MRNKFFDEGTITEAKKPSSRQTKSSKPMSSPQPQVTVVQSSGVDLDELADKIVGRLKDSPVAGTGGKNVDKDTSSLIQIDETIIDTGTDISNLQGNSLKTKEEEKVDDLKEAKERLSGLLRKRKRNSS
jgi:hypothetical protein